MGKQLAWQEYMKMYIGQRNEDWSVLLLYEMKDGGPSKQSYIYIYAFFPFIAYALFYITINMFFYQNINFFSLLYFDLESKLILHHWGSYDRVKGNKMKVN